jgi:hypothetical protein
MENSDWQGEEPRRFGTGVQSRGLTTGTSTLQEDNGSSSRLSRGVGSGMFSFMQGNIKKG